MMPDESYSDQPYSPNRQSSRSPTTATTATTTTAAGRGRMSALDTSPGTAYTDGPRADQENDEEDCAPLPHHDATYTEEDGGATGIMRNDPGRGRRSLCHPMNMFICLAAIVVVAALAWRVGSDTQTKENTEENSSSSSSWDKPNTVGATTTTTTTTTTTATATTTNTEAQTFAFVPVSNLVLPPLRNSSTQVLPEYVHPAVSFGHIVAMNTEGDQVAVAMKSSPNDPASYYGAFDIFRIDLVGTMVHEQTVYEEAPDPLPSEALQYQSLSMHGGRVAITQGRKVRVYYQNSAMGNYVPLEDHDIAYFGPLATTDADQYDPTITYFCVHAALSPGGYLLGLLVSNDAGKPGRVEIYLDEQSHSGDVWKRVTVLELSAPVSGGTLDFDLTRKILAVGWFEQDSEGRVTEYFNTYYSSDFNSNDWTPISMADNNFSGASVVSASIDGEGLAIGSLGGQSNYVTVIRFNEDLKKWTPFGVNHVLHGPNESANYGASVRLGFDDVKQVTRLFVGAPGMGSNGVGQVFVYEYDLASDSWVPLVGSPLESDTPGDRFGSSIAIDMSAENLIVGTPERPQTTTTTTGAFSTYQLQRVP